MSKKKQYIDSIFFLLIFRLFLNSYFSMLSRIIFLLNSIFNKKFFLLIFIKKHILVPTFLVLLIIFNFFIIGVLFLLYFVRKV